jgi:hypothetical protein
VSEEGGGYNGLGGVPSVRVSFFFGCSLDGKRKVVEVDERDDGIYVLAASFC